MDLPPLTFDASGLLPVICQEAGSGEVLMLAYATREALEKTLETRRAHYWSRSRGELWCKGASSGHTQEVLEVRYDCDADALLYRVKQTGPACHTGERSCFYRAIGEESSPPITLARLEAIIDQRLSALPEGSYIASLHRRGLGRIAQKVVEEAGESVVAALEGKREELVGEAADLLFHLLLLLREGGVHTSEVLAELDKRHRAKAVTEL
jgi:phosphoribosyl-ATP pyrophosphohydrolase/phosphoribosyl-AMP cyclohydrolase